MKSVTLVDVVQDECGYRIQFSDMTIGVDSFDDIHDYAADTITRMGDDVLRATLVLKWIQTNALGGTSTISDAGGMTNG